VAMKDVLKRSCPHCGGAGNLCNPKLDSCVERIPCPGCKGVGEVYDESLAWELISDCTINKHWSAGMGVFRDQLRAWFCEIAMAQSLLHQDDPDYPDTGLDPTVEYEHEVAPGDKHATTVGKWWELGMYSFRHQVRHHCHSCGIPLKGHGELAQRPEGEGVEQVSATHQDVYRPKRKGRRVELVTLRSQLGEPLDNPTKYLQNAVK
jgi:hypothetical protein